MLLLLLAGSGSAHGGSPGTRSIVGGFREVDIRNVLDGDRVGNMFSMLLHELLGSRELAGVGGIDGSHGEESGY